MQMFEELKVGDAVSVGGMSGYIREINEQEDIARVAALQPRTRTDYGTWLPLKELTFKYRGM
jgi:hypothetical protein